ncbi:MAG TPA: NAD(P)H-hydrate dehydratase [Bacteroidales bacterium]|nr:NAD(P)H-hydrate dehydratase [Bacteroidales bacterium]HPJ58549.1 NAD(P)H-hydrate dehydratase [Bacteroidales bacterium]HPR11292.1 NAD(P)H-hydrate dehydratase [Bacteroidales bacterium]HRW86319.1 NAD(P)H-hydrate dehydratase [Bacteroidales bacterium]
MKIFRCGQIREIDQYTIINEPIASADLMERAAGKIFEWFNARFSTGSRVLVFSGPGNNGGDGIALSRMLACAGYDVSVFFTGSGMETSADWIHNRKRLAAETKVPFITVDNENRIPEIAPDDIVIDAIFGSGLTRRITGLPAGIIRKINSSGAIVVSVDMPSGLFGEDNGANDPDTIIQASYTLSFQFPKLSFLFPENEQFTGVWEVLSIGLHPEIIGKTFTPFTLTDSYLVKTFLKKRKKFVHKGNFGHGLLAGGSYGKMGAVVLGARAALRSGIGLLTCHIPSSGNTILQTTVPEAMTLPGISEKIITDIPDTESFTAVAVGPGMSVGKETARALRQFLGKIRKPLVIDADALNILSAERDLIEMIPPLTILTPHPGEFSRLAGETSDGYQRLIRQAEFSARHNCIVVLKGASTSVSDPQGNIWFNPTGNPGMATAGSGDTLTGVILSLLAQGYEPLKAAIAGVYIHGLAGDFACSDRSEEALVASDISDCLGEAFKRIRSC